MVDSPSASVNTYQARYYSVLDELNASAYHELPAWIRNKHAVINVQNHDLECFKWAFLAARHKPTSPTNQCEVFSYREYENLYDWSMLSFPVSLDQIEKFEEKNNVSIHVFAVYHKDDVETMMKNFDDETANNQMNIDVTIDQGSPSPAKQKKCDISGLNSGFSEKIDEYQSSDVDSPEASSDTKLKQKAGTIFLRRSAEKVLETYDDNGKLLENRHANLLLTEYGGSHHYSAIKNFSALVNSQISKDGHKKFFCYRCINGFGSQKLLTEHVKSCSDVKAQRVRMPSEKDKMLKFSNIHKQLESRIRVYADFECILKEIEVETTDIGIDEDQSSTSVTYQEHEPCSYGFYVVSDIPEYNSRYKS